MSDETAIQRADNGIVETDEFTGRPSLETAIQQSEAIEHMMDEFLTDGKHYGVVPGTGRPALRKSGAEKICSRFKLRPVVADEQIENLGQGHRDYRYVVELVYGPTGEPVGQGSGSCNTRESKYDHASENPYDIYNTVQKMGFKRALIQAVLVATAASDIFTQDIDEDGYGGSGASYSDSKKGDPFGLEDTLPYKKHRGDTLKETIDEDEGYVDWLLGNVDDFAMTEEARRYYEGEEEPRPDYRGEIKAWATKVHEAESAEKAEERREEYLNTADVNWPDKPYRALKDALDRAIAAREDTDERESEESDREKEAGRPAPERPDEEEEETPEGAPPEEYADDFQPDDELPF